MKEIKDMLLREKEKILTQLKSNFQKTQVDYEIGDAIDSSVGEQDRDFHLLLQDIHRNKLEQIEDALKRIEKQDYGYCEDCGDEISKKRLLLVPFARLCVVCQQARERSTGGRYISNALGETRLFGED